MSCQSLAAARAFGDTDKGVAQCSGLHRSVKFSPEARSSTRSSHSGDKRDTPGSSSMLAISLTPIPQPHSSMSQSAPAHHSILLDGDSPPPPCRFPKLEECAHFHYDRVSLPPLSVRPARCDHEHCARADDSPADEGWICLSVRTRADSPVAPPPSSASTQAAAAAAASERARPVAGGGGGGGGGWQEAGDAGAWRLTRSAHNLRSLDDMLHRCIYDRKVSNLPDLSAHLTPALLADRAAYAQLVADYFHHFSMIADNSINCGPILNWLQMDNKGHKLLVANEDSSSINTPAVAAAYSVRKYVSQARDEISFEVGDMISIIDMPGPNESTWWRGKRGFRVGFFPHHCVSVIGDKAPRHMASPPRVVGSLAVAPIKPVLRKHGKLISLFRSFILSRPSRRTLKQQGILRERVFGCDLGEHLMNCQQEVPVVLSTLATVLESRGAVDGVYRLSGGSTLTQRLRAEFDEGKVPDLDSAAVRSDPHALASLLKTYFRELPNPLCTYQLYDAFVSAAQAPPAERVARLRDTVAKLPPPHYRTLSYLTQHLQRVSLLGAQTGMTARNMAIVWAPNLLRPRARPHALQGVAQQAVITEMLICYASQLFSGETPPDHLHHQQPSADAEERHQQEARGGKPTTATTHLLSLEEAQRRGKPPAPIAAIEIPTYAQLQPPDHHKPKYIEVGSGPNNLPQYHTVLERPAAAAAKRALKRSPSGWRGLLARATLQRAPRPAPAPAPQDETPTPLRPAKSCESLQSDGDTVAPLAAPPAAPLKQHARSSSCDSYFEPWQWELWGMRLRLSPQERDQGMFSEEERDQVSGGSSARATPALSPRRELRIPLRTDADASASTLQSALASLRYIDAGSPRAAKGCEKRPALPAPDAAKRLCKDRESPKESTADLPTPLAGVKLRERTSPRKAKSSTVRYSGLHHPPLSEAERGRLSWHGDNHSTLIRIDWPTDQPTPTSPAYQPLSESEVSDNRRTIRIDCPSCDGDACLKCALKDADAKELEMSPSSTDVSYNLNRLSGGSSNSEALRSAMTNSHDSSSTTNSRGDELYEAFGFARPSYINLQSSPSRTSESPKSPLKSTISITFRSPTRGAADEEETPTRDFDSNTRDSVYENVDLERSLAIVEDASVPSKDACLPTQQACQPASDNLVILEEATPVENVDVYSQVKFLRKSIEEVNALMDEDKRCEARHYENVNFSPPRHDAFEPATIDVDRKLADLDAKLNGTHKASLKLDVGNGNAKINVKVKELKTRFESPTEVKGQLQFKTDIKYEEKNSAKSNHAKHDLNKSAVNTRSLDENAFVQEFGPADRRKSLEVAKENVDLNLNLDHESPITPTSENKLSLIQRFDSPQTKSSTIDDKQLSRERIEKYKEERRNFLREKYASQSFRSNPENLTRIKIKKEPESTVDENTEQFVRRNTLDLGQRSRFSLAKSVNSIDSMSESEPPGETSKYGTAGRNNSFVRKEKMSPSFNIRDMAALFEQKSQNSG